MSVTIQLTPDQERALADRAARDGIDPASYVRRLIERDIASPTPLDELLAPFRRQFEESGMTEEELDALVEEVRAEIWLEKQADRDPGA